MAFALAVVLEHLLEPGLDPLRHMVSEYANRPTGTLMTVGFLAWAVSFAALGALAAGHRLVAGSWGIAAVSTALLAVAHTQTVAGRLPAGAHWRLEGRLHDLGSGLLPLALLFGAVAVAPRRLAAAALVAAAVIIEIALLAVGDSVGGLRQRCLIAVAFTWQLVFLRDNR